MHFEEECQQQSLQYLELHVAVAQTSRLDCRRTVLAKVILNCGANTAAQRVKQKKWGNNKT